MKRLHIHLRVDDLAAAKRFYTAIFSTVPVVEKADYAKWHLDDPRVNLAVSQRAGGRAGIDHLGIQAETAEELDELYARLADASYQTHDEKGARCCYAESDKHWAVDPSGIVWEMFRTVAQAATYGDEHGPSSDALATPNPARNSSAACTPGCCQGCAAG